MVRDSPGRAARLYQRHLSLGGLPWLLLDLAGVPELFEFCWRALAHTSPLTPAEVEAASSVLGWQAIRYADIRVAHGGLLRAVFALNGGRAFSTFHTVNLPETGFRVRTNLPLLVHELAHVLQYERLGSVYIAEALRAQATAGYDYRGAEGLAQALAGGLHYRDYNREQQASIAQDYYRLRQLGHPVAEYEPFVAELRRGEV